MDVTAIVEICSAAEQWQHGICCKDLLARKAELISVSEFNGQFLKHYILFHKLVNVNTDRTAWNAL